MNNAKEDAAEIAWKSLQGLIPEYLLKKSSRRDTNAEVPRLNLVKNLGKEHANEVASSSDRWSESASEETSLFESERRGKLQTFYNPDTGEAFILTPRTSIHSDNGEVDSMSVHEPTNEEAVRNVSDLRDLTETNAEGLSEEVTDGYLERRTESDPPVAIRTSSNAEFAEERISPSKKVSFLEDEEKVRAAKLNSLYVEPESSNKQQMVKGGGAKNLYKYNDDNHDRQQGRESDHTSIGDYVALLKPGRFGFRDFAKCIPVIGAALSYLRDLLHIFDLVCIQKLGFSHKTAQSNVPVRVGKELNLINSTKVFIENLTSASWDW